MLICLVAEVKDAMPPQCIGRLAQGWLLHGVHLAKLDRALVQQNVLLSCSVRCACKQKPRAHTMSYVELNNMMPEFGKESVGRCKGSAL